MKIGDKFKLLGLEWEVNHIFNGHLKQFRATTDGGKDSQVIYLDLDQDDKLEWIKEEKQKCSGFMVKCPTGE